MTDQVCDTPQCLFPLMRNKDRSVTKCVLCSEDPPKQALKPETMEPISKEDTAVPAKEDTEILAETRPSLPPPSEKSRDRAAREQQAIDKLGEAMLRGMVLLNELCMVEGCRIPMVRTNDADRITFCVMCDRKDNAAPSAKLPSLEASVPVVQPAEDRSVLSAVRAEYTALEEEQKNILLRLDKDQKPILQLKRKLEWLASELDRCQDIHRCTEIAACMQQCAQAHDSVARIFADPRS